MKLTTMTKRMLLWRISYWHENILLSFIRLAGFSGWTSTIRKQWSRRMLAWGHFILIGFMKLVRRLNIRCMMSTLQRFLWLFHKVALESCPRQQKATMPKKMRNKMQRNRTRPIRRKRLMLRLFYRHIITLVQSC